MGVNEDQYDPANHQIISMLPVPLTVWLLLPKCCWDNFGIETGFLTTCHAYTATQDWLINPTKKIFGVVGQPPCRSCLLPLAQQPQ
jgi:glyceraldehyde 3-phosphate dehydrogenase